MTESQTTTTVLIRHAESRPNNDLPESDWPLSSLGRRQAGSLAVKLSKSRISHVVSSPYIRAIDTVRPLADIVKCHVEVNHDLRERKLCDEFRSDWYKLLKRAWSDFSFALPNCESGLDCQLRIQNCLHELAKQHIGKTIAVSSHGNAIGLFLNLIDPNFGFEQWERMQNPDVFLIDWHNGSPSWRTES
jgi:2,3-bisphosphoglycerate-dependent phosphoglycerate mutase